MDLFVRPKGGCYCDTTERETHKGKIQTREETPTSDVHKEPAGLALLLLHLRPLHEVVPDREPEPLARQRVPELLHFAQRDPGVEARGLQSVAQGERDGRAEEEGRFL